jgi:hypothetical protein
MSMTPVLLPLNIIQEECFYTLVVFFMFSLTVVVI